MKRIFELLRSILKKERGAATSEEGKNVSENDGRTMPSTDVAQVFEALRLASEADRYHFQRMNVPPRKPGERLPDRIRLSNNSEPAPTG